MTKIEISSPTDVIHDVHVDQNLNWTFDSSVNPKTIFTKLKLVGKGGFGTVYQIVHRPSMKSLAGKVIHTNLMDPEKSEEIENEINILKEINSIYTLKYYGCINFDNNLMILMDFCDRGSLRDILDNRQKVLSEDQISVILRDHLLALRFMHGEHKIMHRDIKAANILMNRHGIIKISDFGVSRRFDSGSCLAVSIVGTPYWMAPEVISAVKYGFSADIWSTGITAIELAEGAPPYVEYPPTKAMIEIASNGFPGYRYPNMHSEEFIDFVSHCLEYEPSKRWNIDQLLQHPFIIHAEKIQRNESIKELITGVIEEFPDDEDEPIKPHSIPSKNDSIHTNKMYSIGSRFIHGTDKPVPLSEEDIQEFLWLKQVRRNSLKIPFVPFVLATNPDAPVKTLYSQPGIKELNEEEEEEVENLNIFNEYGLIKFKTVLKDKRTPYIIAFILFIISGILFGQKGFIFLIVIALISNMILLHINKRKEILNEEEEEGN